ncbi:MAG: Gfo/Idh/MocA family oxidoreductase [Candidatus Binatia bacterium]|nr:Gfo/Idh/MocA family oxidoreductase [Candidatus Binatia bacterium]
MAVRYGIIGFGMMALEHLQNLAVLDGAELVAAADPDEKQRGFAVDLGVPAPAVYADYREMLDKAALDAVIISTPNYTHIDVLRDCLGTETHLLIEKPLCTTMDDCREVERLAEKHAGVVWVGMEYRYMPPVARLIEEVHSGTVGRLRMLAIREHRFPFLPKVGDWNRFARNTGGTLVEKCCHFFDLMNFITGANAVRVYASGAQDVNHLDESYDGETPDILDNAYVIVDYDDGTRALLDLCMFAEASTNQEEIAATGDAGKVECFIPKSTLTVGRRSMYKSESLETTKVEVDPTALKAGFHHGSTYYEHLAFLDAIRSGTKPAVGIREGLRAVAIGTAAELSIAEGRPVHLSEV